MSDTIKIKELFQNYPPIFNISQEKKKDVQLTKVAVDRACSQSILYIAPHSADNSTSNHSLIHAPFSLYPSIFPSKLYKKAYELQPIFNKLVQIIVNEQKFLEDAIKKISKVDSFSAKLFEIYLKTKHINESTPYQKFNLGIFRSDYLMDNESSDVENARLDDLSIKQVELNTISSSFSSLSKQVSDLHKFLRDITNYYQDSQTFLPNVYELPENKSLDGFAKGLGVAHQTYLKTIEEAKANENHEVIVLFVNQNNERNVFDQRLIEYKLFDTYKIRALRYSHEEINEYLAVSVTDNKSNPNRKLLLKSKTDSNKIFEVSVAYFRSGYTPTDYSTETEWQTRLSIEQSFAIKCPSVAVHLAGCKKIQQLLAEPNVLEKFLTNKVEIDLLRSCFTGLYSLDPSPETASFLDKNVLNPKNKKNYVLKPQREGGGNNIYGDDVATFVRNSDPEELAQYVLMDLIDPPSTHGVLVRLGQGLEVQTTSELGIYGLWLSDGEVENPILNESSGHLLRTKMASANEGGVAAGFAVVDSPLLV